MNWVAVVQERDGCCWIRGIAILHKLCSLWESFLNNIPEAMPPKRKSAGGWKSDVFSGVNPRLRSPVVTAVDFRWYANRVCLQVTCCWQMVKICILPLNKWHKAYLVHVVRCCLFIRLDNLQVSWNSWLVNKAHTFSCQTSEARSVAHRKARYLAFLHSETNRC